MDSKNFRTALSAATSRHSVCRSRWIKQEKDFIVHEGLLKDRSAFFNNTLKPNRFQEGFERIVLMPGDDPEVFALYMQYLYRPDLFFADTKQDGEFFEQECIALAELYVFVEKILDQSTKDILLEVFKISSWDRLLPVAAAQIIYRGTSERDPARALFVHSFFRYGQRHSLEAIRNTGHPDFFRDLALALSLGKR